MTDQRNSILIRKQLPEFILENHPRFLSFLEAYYEFLDNNSYGTSKDIRYVSDVDLSLDMFEQQFFNSFMPFIPRDTAINKEFIIKNIMDLYLSKGSPKSYQYLFRMLFNEDVKITYPGQSILRASDGRWVKENLLRVTQEVYSLYLSDGIQTTYYLPYPMDNSKFTVFIDDVEVFNYQTFIEGQKIVFETPVSLNSYIKFFYKNFNIGILNNRKIEGETTGASAIIEDTGKRRLLGSSFFEFLINSKTLSGNFRNGEMVKSDIIFENIIIPFYFQTFSSLDTINIIDGGSKYNIGDPIIIRGISTREAIAIVSDVVSGKIDKLIITDGGCGFEIGTLVYANGYSSNTFNASVITVDSQGLVSSNSITYNTDIIGNFSSVLINSSDYGFSANGNENINSILSSALSSVTLTGLGGITSIDITTTLISSTLSPLLSANPPPMINGGTIKDLGVIGKITIEDKGFGYEVGDQVVFTNQDSLQGQGAEAEIGLVDTTGGIVSVKITNGGLCYDPNYFPKLSIISANGSNGILSVEGIMGDGEILTPVVGNTAAGKILSIKILDKGMGYIQNPGIDLSTYGDRKALANSTIQGSYITQGGRWETSDGLLSSEDIVLQGRDYYINYSYVTTASVEFYKYKNIVKQLLHPAGLINYAKYSTESLITLNEEVLVTSSLETTTP